MRELLCLFIFVFFNTNAIAQEFEIRGQIVDTLGKPVGAATVTLNLKNKILSYAISNNEGDYQLELDKKMPDTLMLKVRSLGFLEHFEEIIPINSRTTKDIVLNYKPEDLDEVLIVESRQPMRESNDTITYSLNFYTNQTEQTVEDVLKKLPGVEVSDDGTIKYLEKEISKMLIDGDDLVDDQYTLLSKNLDSELLENVQVLRNYDENPLRKKFGEGDDVAINLSIKDDKKNILFGKATAGAGTKSRYLIKSNLGLLRDNFKILNLNEINNIGTLLSPKNRFNNVPLQELWTRNSKKEANTVAVVDNEIDLPGFLSPDESVRNKSELASFTTSYKWNENLNLRALAYLTKDRLNFNARAKKFFFTGNDPISYTERTDIEETLPNLYANAEIKHYNQNNWYTTFETELKSGPPQWNQNLLLNRQLLTAGSNGKNTNFNNHLNLTYQPSETVLWENYAYFSFSDYQQDFMGAGLVFNSEYEQQLTQISAAKQVYSGLNSRLRFKDKKKIIKFSAGVEKEKDQFSSLIVAENLESAETFDAARDIDFLNINAQVETTFHFKNKKDLKVKAGYTHKNSGSEIENFDLVQAGLSYSFPVEKAGRFALNYSHKQQLSNFFRNYSGYHLINYRTIRSGLETPLKIDNNSFGLTHTYQNPSQGFLMFNIISYTNYNKGYISRNFIDEDFTIIDIEEGKGGELLIAQNQLTKYFDAIATSIKLENGYNFYLNYLSANQEEILPAKNHNITSSLSGTTYFDIPVNFTFSAEYQHNRSNFDQRSSRVQNIILGQSTTYKIKEELLATANLDFYNLNTNKHSFLSAEINFVPKQSKWNFQLMAKNLLNIRNFTIAETNDFQLYENTVQIIPRYIMLIGHLRF